MSDGQKLIAQARGLRASERRGPGIEAEMRTLLPALADLAESLIADQKEYNAESIRHHCEWMNKRAEFHAAIERVSKERNAARAEVERLKERAARDDAGVTIHACPPTDSGIMPCCGRTPFEVMADRMTTKPEFVNCDRVRLQTERAALAQENARLINEVGTLDATAREQRQRAEVLARGVAAYRTGSYTLAQVWENEEGKAVT